MRSAGARVAVLLLAVAVPCAAATERPLIGIWVTDIYDLDPNNRSFSAKFWLWSVVPAGAKIKPLDTVFVRHARQFTTARPVTIEKDGLLWTNVAATAVVRHQWDLRSFPFDEHELTIVLEDSAHEASALQYAVDARQSGIDPDSLPRAWRLAGFRVALRTTTYPTTFGDPGLSAPQSQWTQLAASIHVQRAAMGIFLKLLIGAYVAFLLAMMSFLLKTDQPTLFSARLALLVGSLFATVVNLRSTEAVIGRSEHFTLVDKIHLTIALYIFVAAVAALLSRRDNEREKPDLARRRDRIAIVVFGASFVAVNVALVIQAMAR